MITKDKINHILWTRFPWLAVKLHSVGNNTVLDNAEFMTAYLELMGDGPMFLSLRETFNLYYYVSRAKTLDGDMAEVGVFQGRGAKLIGRFKGGSRLHLFDTFEGMPAIDQNRDNHHKPGDFKETSLEQVRAYLKNVSNIEFHPGYFPETAMNSSAASKIFSFVHLDADLFQSTLEGLNFFYPRLVEGGFLIAHDYSSASCTGVKAAFDVFCKETNVMPIPLWDTHCLIIKHTKS